MSKLPITLTVFIHEDLKDYNQDLLFSHHFDWLKHTITKISGRAIYVNFVQPSDAPSMSNLDYKTDDLEKLLTTMAAELEQHISAKNTSLENSIRKFLLLTRDDINKNVLGVAFESGSLAVASITNSATAAHEVGHMLSANHQDSDKSTTTYYGTVNSIMYATTGSTGFRFSDKNKDNIRNYLDQFD